MAGSMMPSLSAETLDQTNAMRKEAGLPLAPVGSVQLLFHLLHRGWALVVTGAVAYFCVFAYRNRLELPSFVRSAAIVMGGVVSVQFLLGVLTVLSLRDATLTSFHVILGALLLAFSALTAFRCWEWAVRVGGQTKEDTGTASTRSEGRLARV